MKHIPNSIPLADRITNFIFSVILIAYGGYGIYINDLYLPGGRRSRGGIHLHDEPALIMYAAFICGCLVMLSVIIDHYDKRNNEHKYKTFAKVFKYIGWGLFWVSVVWNITK